MNATYNAATDVPVIASGYTATGNTVNFTLNFAPATGTDLMVVSNTALPFINGKFDNLAQGQSVALSYGGVTYRFVANYYGGNGNDLVLVWATTHPFAWGCNGYSQLGDGTTTERHIPVPVAAMGALAGKTVLALAAGGAGDAGHSVALCSDGTVATWGWANSGIYTNRVPVAFSTERYRSTLYGKTVIAIAAGWYHTLMLCSDGTVAGWGRGYYNSYGNNYPVAINTNAGTSALYGKTVVAISAGTSHSLALCSDGTVAAWGGNQYGQLGDNTTTDRSEPVAVSTNAGVSALCGKTVVAVAAGWFHSLALCSDGTVAAWGYNMLGQLGDNTTTPRPAPVPVAVDVSSALFGKNVISIGVGGAHCQALCSDGTVATWGDNQVFELGDHTTRHFIPTPVAVATNAGISALHGKQVVAVSAGMMHNLALCSDGTVAGWGSDEFGQIGDNTTTNHNAPVAVNTAPLAATQRFSRVASGSTAYHSLALVAGPPPSPIMLTSSSILADRSFRSAFTNSPGAFFSVLAATNPTLPPGDWTSLTGPTEVTPGQFQFTDPQATTNQQRFYRVRSP